jgi:hypothetical protein
LSLTFKEASRHGRTFELMEIIATSFTLGTEQMTENNRECHANERRQLSAVPLLQHAIDFQACS